MYNRDNYRRPKELWFKKQWSQRQQRQIKNHKETGASVQRKSHVVEFRRRNTLKQLLYF